MFVYLFLVAAVEVSTVEPLTIETTEKKVLPIISAQKNPFIITNAIEPRMLEYKHWSGTYKPDIFTLAINGTEVPQGTHYTLPAETKNVDIMFSYSFRNGKNQGTKTVSYDLHEDSSQAHITFSWENDWQVLLDNGKAVKKVST